MMTKSLFEEEQGFNALFVQIPLGITLAFLLFGAYYQGFVGDFGSKPMPAWAWILFAILILGIMALIQSSRLRTRYSAKGIEYQFFPYHRKMHTILWSDVKERKIRKYSPIGEFGGWGLRARPGKRAYNAKGNMGLQIELKDGMQILFGTQEPEKIQAVLDQIKK